jgi:sortase A
MVRVILDPPEKPRRSTAQRLVAAVRTMLLLTGVSALGYCAYVYTDAKVYEAYENWSLDQQAQGKASGVIAFLRDMTPLRYVLPTRDLHPDIPEPDRTANAREQEPARPRPVAPRELIGRIMIPRLGVRGIVQEGVDDKTLRRAVGHVPGTAMPGEGGNVGLAAHRDTFFRGLKDVRKNDRIRLETSNGDYEYQVDSIRIVKPNDVEVLASTRADRALTLVTCYPFYYVGNAPKRFIVRAKLIELKPRELQGS